MNSNETLESLWPTDLLTGQLDAAALSALRENPDRLASLLPHADHPESLWDTSIETWPGGYHAAIRHGRGDRCAVVVLQTDGDDPDSGALILHDPRAGAPNVALPGLPWGRPITLPAVPGTLTVMPGWLSWQVAPVRAGHRRTVLIAHSR